MSSNKNQSPLGIKAAFIAGVLGVIGTIVAAWITKPESPRVELPKISKRPTQYIIDFIKEKRKFRVQLDEPIGTLDDSTHKVSYENGRFVSYGIRLGTNGKEQFWCAVPGYDNAILDNNQITLWNAPFTFDEDKNLYYEERIVGRLELNDSFSTGWKKGCYKREKVGIK